MLPKLPDHWRVEYYADGVALVPSDGTEGARIRIRDRQRPLRSAAYLAQLAVQDMAHCAPATPAIERLTTMEAEFAAVITVCGSSGGEPCERELGVVFGDHSFTLVDGGVCVGDTIATIGSAVRTLTRNYSLGLGELRRRRFEFEPPTGWDGRARGLISEWLSPGFPHSGAAITVFPARPVTETAAGVLDLVLHELDLTGFEPSEIDGGAAVTTPAGLSGTRWRAVGASDGRAAVHQEVVALEGERFFYVARLESGAAHLDANRAVFAQLIDTIQPLPRPELARPEAGGSLSHWSE